MQAWDVHSLGPLKAWHGLYVPLLSNLTERGEASPCTVIVNQSQQRLNERFYS